jgi:ABC-type sugar transport system ATPase subunit
MDMLLEAKRIGKSFAGIPVLQDVSFALQRGEVHALMGENGAGKSTLVKAFAGLHQPDSGELWFDGREVRFRDPHAALTSGIAMIHQELMPFRELSVAENVWIGHEPTRTCPGWLDHERMHRSAHHLLARLGATIPTHRRMGELSVAEMQVVEIAKALAHNAQVLIMDEPTSALTDAEARALFNTIRELRDRGAGVIYISHKFEEVFELADRITVLRDGRLIATAPVREFTPESLIRYMVGRGLSTGKPGSVPHQDQVALSVCGLSRHGAFEGVTFDVHYGEILGVAGLLGAGRTELLNALYGMHPVDSGEIRVGNMPTRIRNPRHAQAAGIGLVTEDRAAYGLVPTLGLTANITLAALRSCCRAGVIQRRTEARLAGRWIDSLFIRSRGAHQAVNRLSGGNQQKAVIARTLMHDPVILLLDEPTRGIDIGAKSEIHTLIRNLAEQGKAIVLVSSELPELITLSHRILVMREGAVAAELDGAGATAEKVMSFAVPH